ncbi:MAG: TIGR04168 family protein [Planctomycetes bacterium]|nr:TIGR04168 family protein [Planctomycetota bacterium]
MTSHARPFRILVVGDVHGHWTDVDTQFVEGGDQDLTIFIGDLGDEDTVIARRISEIDAELGIVLGNHDAWQSFSQKEATPALREILALFGDDHLGYTRRELPAAGLTLVGARPFSWGGRDIRSPELYADLWGITSHEESAERIVGLVAAAEHDDVLIVAHNGPLGMSQAPGDIWGKDFGMRPGGDWGDRDLRFALDRIPETGKRVRGVIAGHMHDRLLFPRGASRRRFARRDGIDFMNPAVVPRIRRDPEHGDLHHFLRTDWLNGALVEVDEIWVDETGVVRRHHRPDLQVADEE